MRPALLPLLLALSLSACSSRQAASTAPEKPGLVKRTWTSMQFWKKGDDEKPESKIRHKKLEATLVLNPESISLFNTRQITATLRVTNKSAKPVTLEFPTTQRVDVLVRDTMGKLVYQWSEDQSFEKATSLLQLNRNERAEFSVNIPTRDMVADKSYFIEAVLPTHETLRVERQIIPTK